MEWQARRDSLGWNEATYQRLLSAYYGYVSMIDEGVGQLMMTLREEGLFDDTLIVFSADHGEFGGQFRAFYKGLPYEASCHVPLIIRDPRDSGGRRCSQNTSNIDLFSTILNTAGVDPPHDIESRDLTDLVSGNESTWDNRTVWKKGNQSFLVRDASKLVRGNVGGHDVYELYDLGVDPLEERNLIDDVDQSSAISALRQELDAWHQDQDDKGRARVGAS